VRLPVAVPRFFFVETLRRRYALDGTAYMIPWAALSLSNERPSTAMRTGCQMKPDLRTIAVSVAGLVALIGGAFLSYEPTVSWSDAIRSPRCVVTPNTLVLPGVFGPVPGESPVWFERGSAEVWHRREPLKSVLVLSREAAGALRLQGHRVDGSGELEFQRDTDGDVVRTLDIADPWHDSMRPGGANVTARYAFVATSVYYSSPGCWELVARLGDREVRIVTLVKTALAAAFEPPPSAAQASGRRDD
jgi:hypothetical protein